MNYERNLYKQKCGVYGMFDFRVPRYVIREPEGIKQIAIKDFDHFEDHATFTDEKTDSLFGNNLFFMKGERWRQMRATLRFIICFLKM